MLKIRSILIGIIFTCVTGCGFHLRGQLDLPTWLEQIEVVNQHVHRDLNLAVKNVLQSNITHQVALASSEQKWLILEKDTLVQHVSSISSGTTARQYQLIYTVQFRVEAAQQKITYESQTVTVTRQLTVNSERILGSSDEQQTLENEMRQEAAWLILDRLRAEKL